MKSPFHFSPALPVLRVAGVAAAAAMLLLVAGCGQKGPLYMPKPPAPHPVRTAPADVSADSVDSADSVVKATDKAGATSTVAPQAK